MYMSLGLNELMNVFEWFVESIQMKCLMRIGCLTLNDFGLEIIYMYRLTK